MMSVAVEQDQIIRPRGPSLQSLLALTLGYPAGTICAISERQMAVVATGKEGDALETIYAKAKDRGEEMPLIWQVPDPKVLWAF